MDMTPTMPKKTPRNLNRAKACNNCRRRKTKCDAKRPHCSQCLARNKPGVELACEYPVVGRTRKQTLEESISTLEKRIRELERSEPDEDSIRLYDPSRVSSPSSSSSFIGSSSPSSSGSSLLLDPLEPTVFATAFQEEIPTALRQRLLSAFVPHARSFGFFLNMNRFISAITLPLNLGDYSRPCAGLVCVVYLIGLHLSGASEDEETAYLSRALLHVSNVLSANHPLRLIHGTQAEILLSMYFFRTGRFLEGKYHLSAAVSLATCAGLDKLRSANINSPPNLMGIGNPLLPEPNDIVDEGERINAFWTVFANVNCWGGLGLGGFSCIMFETYGSRIDTPWPLDMEDYEENRIPSNYIGVSTIRKFLTQSPDLSMNGSSKMGMFAQSSLLLERATNLACSYTNKLRPEEHTRFMNTLTSLDALIDSFYSHLSPLSQTPVSSADFVIVWATHLICHVATIKLHGVFGPSNDFSHKKAFESAESCVVLVRGMNLSHVEVNPIFALLWRTAGQFIIEEISRLNGMNSPSQALSMPTWEIENHVAGRRMQLAALLEELFLTMETFVVGSKIIAYQLNEMRESYRSCFS